MNLNTPEIRRRAAGLVKEGYSVSLSRATDTAKALDNSRPFGHKMISSGVGLNPMFTMDAYTTSFHGASLTHMVYSGKLYKGYAQNEVNESGAHRLAVSACKNGFLSRGILMDSPRLKAVKCLDSSTPIYPSDLDAWEKTASIRVGTGDIVFVRTGRWTRWAEKGPWDNDKAAAGLHDSCARWFKKRDIAVLGSDADAKLMPSPVAGIAYPIHQLLVVAMRVLTPSPPAPGAAGADSPLNPTAAF